MDLSANTKTSSKKPKKSNLKRSRETGQDNLDDLEPDFLAQFEEQRFEDFPEGSRPSASNDVTGYGTPSIKDLFKHQIASDGRWSQFRDADGTYGLTKVTADGLLPLYRNKGSYGPDSQTNIEERNQKLDLFTGTLKDTFRQKEVIGQIFEPRPMDDPYGGKIYSASDLRSRVNIGDTYKGIQPMESQQVAPGLGLGYDGSKGMHGMYDMHREMPATIDEMRFKPKISYEGRINETVLKHVERPMVAPVISYRVPTYTQGKNEDMMPKRSDRQGDPLEHRANPELRPTDRVNQLTSYAGHASTTTGSAGHAKPEILHGTHEESRRQNFTLPIVEHRYSKDQTKFNSNTQDYYVPTTMRDVHSVQQIGIPTSSITAAKVQDHTPLDTTLKQTTLHTSRQNLTAPNQQSATETHNWHPLKTTIGETTVAQPRSLMVTGDSKGSAACTAPRDALPTTLQETTLHQGQIYVTGPSASAADTQSRTPLKTTLHETTLTLPRSQFITGDSKGSAASTASRDALPTTTQETTLHQSRSYVQGQQQGAASTASRDPLRQTMQETTLHQGRTYVQGQQQGAASTASRSPLRQTTQETTLHQGRQNFTGPDGFTTDTANWLPTKTTRHETTLHQVNGQYGVQGQTQGQASSFDRSPAPTTRAETLLHQRNGQYGVQGQTQGQASSFSRTPTKTTKAETLLHQRNGQYSVQGQTANQTNTFDRTPTRTTRQETTLHQNNGQYGVQGQSANQTNTLDRTPTRTTRMETTLHQQNGQYAVQGQRGSTTDTSCWIPAKSTYRQTTGNQPTRSMVTGTTALTTETVSRDPAKATHRQTTGNRPTQSVATAVDQAQGSASTFSWIPLKRTQKETTIDAQYIGQADGTNVIGKGHGYLTENHSVPVTRQETTLIKDHVKPIRGPDAQVIYDSYYDVELPEDKITLSTINRAPTASNVSLTPNPDHVNYQLRSRASENDREMYPTQPLDQLVNLPTENNFKTVTDMSRADRSLDADLVTGQLASNPYHQNILVGGALG
jgi:hypothetical protein